MWLVLAFLIILMVAFIIGTILVLVRQRNTVAKVTKSTDATITDLNKTVSKQKDTIMSLERQFQQHVDLVNMSQSNLLLELNQRNRRLDSIYSDLTEKVVEQETTLNDYFRTYQSDISSLSSSLLNLNTNKLQVNGSASVRDGLQVNGLAEFPGSLLGKSATFSNLCLQDVCINSDQLKKITA